MGGSIGRRGGEKSEKEIANLKTKGDFIARDQLCMKAWVIRAFPLSNMVKRSQGDLENQKGQDVSVEGLSGNTRSREWLTQGFKLAKGA